MSNYQKMEKLCDLVSKFASMKCTKGGHYAFEAGYKDSLLKRLAMVEDVKTIPAWLDHEIQWVENSIKVLESFPKET